MRILHIITNLQTGGAEKLMVDLLPRLRDFNNDVELLLFDGSHTPFYYWLEKEGIKINLILCIRITRLRNYIVLLLAAFITLHFVQQNIVPVIVGVLGNIIHPLTDGCIHVTKRSFVFRMQRKQI